MWRVMEIFSWRNVCLWKFELGWSEEEEDRPLPLLLDRRRLVLVYRLNFFQCSQILYLLIANWLDCKAWHAFQISFHSHPEILTRPCRDWSENLDDRPSLLESAPMIPHHPPYASHRLRRGSPQPLQYNYSMVASSSTTSLLPYPPPPLRKINGGPLFGGSEWGGGGPRASLHWCICSLVALLLRCWTVDLNIFKDFRYEILKKFSDGISKQRNFFVRGQVVTSSEQNGSYIYFR
jgi:hypothetical protein